MKLSITDYYLRKRVNNWVIKLAKAAPSEPYSGISIIFRNKLINTPVKAMIFNCFKLPLAVNNVPKCNCMIWQ
ncbi:MAG: hypothetical protein CM15mP65_23300 [Crocinitomicaceae bacterium]|nr:MAG: hypothetical protein CM15mP65_23300 [Crocinitomicaceae bacterium]